MVALRNDVCGHCGNGRMEINILNKIIPIYLYLKKKAYSQLDNHLDTSKSILTLILNDHA